MIFWNTHVHLAVEDQKIGCYGATAADAKSTTAATSARSTSLS
jgi:hypothetical protein